jgi:hypothetical protein
MLKLESDKQHFAKLNELIRDQELQNYLKDKSSRTSLEKAILQWLGTLSLFYGVPFVNFVPDQRMLPVESIRFFYVDPNWTDSMLDGAMSIVTHSTRDELLQLNQTGDYRRGADETRLEVRPALFNQKAPVDSPIGATMTGFLMRSQVVAGWPGLEVKAYRDPQATASSEIAPLLRLDRLAPDVLLVLIPAIPAVIHISEPSEGLRFGVSAAKVPTEIKGGPEETTSGRYLVAPRGLGLKVDGKVHWQAGQQITDDSGQWVEVPLRPGGGRVLNVLKLQESLGRTLRENQALNHGETKLTPAEFGLQLVRAPDRQVYTSGLDTRRLKPQAPKRSLRDMDAKNRLFKKIFQE